MPHILILLVMMSFCSVAAYAKDLTIDDVRKLQGEIKSSDQLSVEFDQKQYSALRNKTVTRKGKAEFAKPNKFRWMLITPEPDYKIFNGKELYDYKPELKTAVRYSPQGGQARQLHEIVDLVLNFDSLLKRYDLVKAMRTGDEVKVELKPKTKGEITKVDLTIDMSRDFISYLRFYLPNKNHMALEFKSPKRGGLAASVFELPQGVKVTDSN